MKYLKYLAVLGLFMLPAGKAHAQVQFSVGVRIGPVYGPAPVCAYGYYPYSPYRCAPYGYYGPDYFVNGIFIGAGPWFHGYRSAPRYYAPRPRYPAPRYYNSRPNVRPNPGFNGRFGNDRDRGFQGRGDVRGGREFRGGGGSFRSGGGGRFPRGRGNR